MSHGITISAVLLLFGALLAFTVSAQYSSTPAPMCGTVGPGCYDTEGNSVPSGTLGKDSFGHYYGETVCQTGGCTCTRDKTTESGKQEDPDETAGACQCLEAGDWDSNGKCCGDDVTDCGKVEGGAICQIDANFRESSWHRADQGVGEIVYLGCKTGEYLSDGTQWHECGDTLNKKMVSDHEYLCTGGQESNWIECCGSDSCQSAEGGVRLATGQAVEIEGGKYYCASDNRFTEDLDTKDEETCEQAAFDWTGSKCCGEPEDGQESYNDITGGCFEGQTVYSVSFAPDTGESVVNFNGQFHGCFLAGGQDPTNDQYLQLTDEYTGSLLVTDNEACALDPTGSYFCSATEVWKPSGGSARSELKEAPVPADQPSECCAATSCWDGESCVPDQSNDPFGQPIVGDYRCILGEWQRGEPKLLPDGSFPNPPVYCPEETQCLVNPLGNPSDNNDPSGNPQCIAHAQYQEDNLCWNGEWASRTRNVALKLLDIKPSGEGFTLFCDGTQNTLNEINFLTETSDAQTAEILQNTNNICLLKHGEIVAAGTTFNIAPTQQQLRDLFGLQNGCQDMAEDGDWHKCDTAGKVWYNSQLKSLIFSDSELPQRQTSIMSLLVSFLRNPIDTVSGRLDQTLGNPAFDVDATYKNGIWRFERLYISEQSGKGIFAVMKEQAGIQSVVVEYSGFSTDICDFTSSFSARKGDSASGIECTQEGSDYLVLAQGSQFTTFQPEDAWTDLTSKLRIE